MDAMGTIMTKQLDEGITERAKLPTYFCVGSNHRTAAISTREHFYLSPEQIHSAILTTSKTYSIDELAVVSTCNRCEVFGVADQTEKLTPEFLYNVYRHVHSTNRNAPFFSSESLSKSLYVLTGVDAVRHAFQVASSLDSLVPGETQITGQFKDAMNIARDAGTLGSMLMRLSQEALATAKRIRTNTDIGRHRVSIAHAAIDLARRASEDLSKLRFLIIGAGEMARVAAEYANGYKPAQLMIANRTNSRAFELTERLGFGQAHDLQNLTTLIARADVVISATACPSILVHANEVFKAMKSRSSSPLFLIDISLPRNIDPETGKLDDVYLFDIDDLKTVVESHIEKRREALRAASNIVSESLVNFEQWLFSKELSPTLSASSQYFADICRKEGDKTLAREIFNNLSDKQRAAITAMLESISAKLTSDVAQALKKTPEEEARYLTSLLDVIFRKDFPNG
jgi:glutamyl-tRNA reductase